MIATDGSPPTFADRYSSAIRSSALLSRPSTTHSPTDILGAVGLASKTTLSNGQPGAPLAMALARLFVGDNHATSEIVGILAIKLRDKSVAWRFKLKRTKCDDMAAAVLAWHRDGVCKTCGGHGYRVMGNNGGRAVLADTHCMACHGTGRVEFDRQFVADHRPLARWLLAEVERELSKAGPAAMAALAPRLEL